MIHRALQRRGDGLAAPGAGPTGPGATVSGVPIARARPKVWARFMAPITGEETDGFTAAPGVVTGEAHGDPQEPDARLRPLPGDQGPPRERGRRCPAAPWSTSTTTPNNGPPPASSRRTTTSTTAGISTGPPSTIRSPSWVESLEKVPEQGFYTLRREITLDGGANGRRARSSSSATRGPAEPILFIAQQRATLAENDLFFSDKGVGIKRDSSPSWSPPSSTGAGRRDRSHPDHASH